MCLNQDITVGEGNFTALEQGDTGDSYVDHIIELIN